MHSGTLWPFHQQSSHNFHDEHRRSPCDLTLLNAAGDAGVDPYAQYTLFTVLEFGASYGSGGIGSLVQPLIGERVFGTLKPNRLE